MHNASSKPFSGNGRMCDHRSGNSHSTYPHKEPNFGVCGRVLAFPRWCCACGVQRFTRIASKNAADMAIAVDAIHDFATMVASHVAVISNDSDFAALFVKLQELADANGQPPPFQWITVAGASGISRDIQQFVRADLRWDIVVPGPAHTNARTDPTIALTEPLPRDGGPHCGSKAPSTRSKTGQPRGRYPAGRRIARGHLQGPTRPQRHRPCQARAPRRRQYPALRPVPREGTLAPPPAAWRESVARNLPEGLPDWYGRQVSLRQRG